MGLFSFLSERTAHGDSPGKRGPREFLYLDIARVRSLLAQLERGVVEGVVESHRGKNAARIGIAGLGSVDVESELASEETKSLSDALFLLFEEAAGRLDIVHEPDPWAWESGSALDSLQEGQIVRVSGDIRIVDGQLVRERTERLVELSSETIRLQHAAALEAMNHRQQERFMTDAIKKLFDGTPPEMLKGIGRFIELFMGGQITVRVFPHLAGDDGAKLLGPLVPGCVHDQRESLFTKYGSGLSRWTVVAQVASLPKPQDELRTDLDDLDMEDAGGPDGLDRAAFEEMASGLMEMMEALGFAGGPQYPDVAISPLAIYREIPLGAHSGPSMDISRGARAPATEMSKTETTAPLG